jgi:hypothetical protein
MARIKYQEAIGLEVKRGRPPAGPHQLVLDEVKDLNEFYNPTRGKQ